MKRSAIFRACLRSCFIFSWILLGFSRSLRAEPYPLTQFLSQNPSMIQGELIGAQKIDRGWLIRIKPLHKIQGDFLEGHHLSFFVEAVFEKSPNPFETKKEGIFFLKELPGYTAFKSLKDQGVLWMLENPKTSFWSDPQGSDAIRNFLEEWLRIKPSSPQTEPIDAAKQFLIRSLRTTPSLVLKEKIAEELFSNPSFKNRLLAEDLQAFAALVPQEGLSPTAKILITEGLVGVSSFNTAPLLKSLFCVFPEEVCLKVSEALEVRGNRIQISDYQNVFLKASPTLKAGLLGVLARHQRMDAVGLFQTTLAIETDEPRAAAIIESLANLGGKKAEELCLRYAKDSRYFVRVSSLTSLGRLKSVAAIPLLEEALKTSDPTLVSVAAQSLQWIGTPEAISTLGKYYHKSGHGHWEPGKD